jgi:hypothetical protein
LKQADLSYRARRAEHNSRFYPDPHDAVMD